MNVQPELKLMESVTVGGGLGGGGGGDGDGGGGLGGGGDGEKVSSKGVRRFPTLPLISKATVCSRVTEPTPDAAAHLKVRVSPPTSAPMVI